MFKSLRLAAIAALSIFAVAATAQAAPSPNAAPQPLPSQQQAAPEANMAPSNPSNTSGKDFSTAESRRAILKSDKAALHAAKSSGDKAAWKQARENMKQDAMAAKEAVSASSQNRKSLMNGHDTAHQSPSKMNGSAK